MSSDYDTSVLIVGGGPSGLSMSIMLSRLGVSSLLVEKHADAATHPKAAGISTRTMELFRQWGVDDRVRAAGFEVEVAARFRERNVFLVGDAAHRMTPSGGMGMNTAIHAAHNLAWELAAVIRGWAAPSLLDTYEVERRPVRERNEPGFARRHGGTERAPRPASGRFDRQPKSGTRIWNGDQI